MLHVHFQSCLPIAFWKFCVSGDCGSAWEHMPSVHKTLCSMPVLRTKHLELSVRTSTALRCKRWTPYPGPCNLERSDSSHRMRWPPLSLSISQAWLPMASGLVTHTLQPQGRKSFSACHAAPPGSKGFLSPKSELCHCWHQKWTLLGSLGRYKQQDSGGKLSTKWRVSHLHGSMFPHSGNSPLLCHHVFQCKLLKVLMN